MKLEGNYALDNAVRYYGELLAKHGLSILTSVECSTNVEYNAPSTFFLQVEGYSQKEDDCSIIGETHD